MKMKRPVLVVLINLLIPVVFFAIAEIVIRVSHPHIKLPGTDSVLIKENVYSTTPGLNRGAKGFSKGTLKEVSSQGFWEYQSKGDSTSILFLGDSVTMGIGEENDSTFAGIINNRLESTYILNPSLIGYSSTDYLKIINKLIAEDSNQLGISAVYLFWCLNDVYDNYGNKNAPGFDRANFFGKVMSYIRSNSKLYLFLKKNFTDRPKAYFNFDKQYYDPESLSFKKAIRNINEIDSILGDSGIKFSIILLPYEYQLRNLNDPTLFAPQTIMKDSLRPQQISLFDLSDTFRSYPNPEGLYQYGDGIHFSKAGHQQIANDLINNLFK